MHVMMKGVLIPGMDSQFTYVYTLINAAGLMTC